MKQSGFKISALVFALLLVAAGVLLFAFNAGLLPAEYKSFIFSWPMLLIAVGFTCLFSRYKWILGIIMILAGGFFILPKLDIEALAFLKGNGWAIALVILGIFILCKILFGRSCRSHYFNIENHPCHHHRPLHSRRFGKKSTAQEEFRQGAHQGNYPKHETGYIERNYVFGGMKERLEIADFKGGEINCIFGGTELDLSACQLAEGIHHLEINSVFGGVVLYVPVHWKIEIRQTRVFGSFEDHRPSPNFDVDEKRVLIIGTSAIFGGGEIKSK